MNIFIILSIFILLAVPSSKSQDNFKKIFFDLQEYKVGDRILDSCLSPTNNTLYLATKNGIFMLNITSIYDVMGDKITQISNYILEDDETPLTIEVLDKYLVIILNNSKTNSYYIEFLNITKEYVPTLVPGSKTSLNKLLNRSISITNFKFSKDHSLIFLIEKYRDIIIIKMEYPQMSLIKIAEIPTPLLEVMLLSEDEVFIFYLTNSTLNLINITNYSLPIISEIDTSFVLTDFYDFINYGGQKLFKQISFSPDLKSLHLLYCPLYWDAWFYTYNISNMSNITYQSFNDSAESCDIERDEIFLILPDKSSAIMTNMNGLVLLNYPELTVNSFTRIWVSKIYPMNSGIFIGEINIAGKITIMKTMEFNLDDVTSSFVYMIPSIVFAYYSVRTDFMFALNSSLVFMMYGGYAEIWDVTDKIRPFYVTSLNDHGWTTVGLYASNIPDSPYFFLYTFVSEGNFPPINLIVYNKSSLEIVSNTFIQQGDINIHSCQITLINDIAYLIPINQIGKNGIDHIITINITQGGYTNQTNVKLGNKTMISSISSCQNFIFYIVSSEDGYLHIMQQDSINYTILNHIADIFLSIDINEMKTSNDCNYLFLGGTNLIFLNITNKTSPFIIKNIPIFNVYEIQLIDKFMYVMTESSTKKLDISDISNPKLLLNQNFPFKYYPVVANYKTVILNSNDIFYLYRSFYDNTDTDFHMRSAVSMVMEQKSSYYLFLLNDNTPSYVGISVTYRYYIFSTKFFYGVSGVIKSVQLGKTMSDFNSLEVIPLPNWITFNFDSNEIYISADKSYLHKRIVITFIFEEIINTDPVSDASNYIKEHNTLAEFQQTIVFPETLPSLEVVVRDYNKLIVKTPSNETIIAIFSLDISDKCQFLRDTFTGVFISLASENTRLSATGYLNPINEMLLNLRYSCANNVKCEQIYFSLELNDQINEDYSGKFTLCNLKRNSIPHVYNAENTLQSQYDRSNVVSIPTLSFVFSFLSNTFVDDDGDALNYRLENSNNKSMAEWINFDEKNLMIYGNPLLLDEGIYKLTIFVDDGYDQNYDILSFRIFDEPPSQNISFANQIAEIGKEFSFVFDDNAFYDNDGPKKLEYSFSVINVTNNQWIQIDIDSYWLKFYSGSKKFSGIPHIDSLNNELQINLIVSDGLKVLNVPFNLKVQQSLLFETNNTFPFVFSSDDESNLLTLSINNTENKLLVPYKILSDNNVSCNTENNMTKIQLIGSALNINLILKNLMYRKIINSPSKQRLCQENFLAFQIKDSLGQLAEKNYNIENFKNESVTITLNRSVNQDNKFLIEIGKTCQITLDLAIFSIPNPLIQTKFQYKITDSSGNQDNFLQFNSENFQFYSLKSIESYFLGYYQVNLTIIDEFADSCSFQFYLDVDYSLTDKILQAFKWIAAIFGPIMSIIAGIKYYYFLYNFIQQKSLKLQNQSLDINKKIKWRFPMIQDEYEISQKICLKAIKIIKKQNLVIFDKFILDNKANPLGISKYQEFSQILQQIDLYNSHPNRNISTVNCIVEGLLHLHAIKNLPLVLLVMNSMQSAIPSILKKKRKMIISQWYDYFFVENTSIIAKDENFVFIREFCLQEGKFSKSEKNIKISLNRFHEVLNKAMSNLKAKKSISENEKIEEDKYFLIHLIILTRRGLTNNQSSFSVKINRIFSFIGLRILSYRIGDSLFCNSGVIDNVFCNLKYEKKLNAKKTKEHKEFFAISSKTVPYWLTVIQKNGVLIIKGEPPAFEEGHEYVLRIKDKRNLNILEFSIKIKDSGTYISQKDCRLSPVKMGSLEKSKNSVMTEVKPLFFLETENKVPLPTKEILEKKKWIECEKGSVDLEIPEERQDFAKNASEFNQENN